MKFKKTHKKSKELLYLKNLADKVGGVILKSMREDINIDKVMKNMNAKYFNVFIKHLKKKDKIKSTTYKNCPKC